MFGFHFLVFGDIFNQVNLCVQVLCFLLVNSQFKMKFVVLVLHDDVAIIDEVVSHLCCFSFVIKMNTQLIIVLFSFLINMEISLQSYLINNNIDCFSN